ncbi:MAG: hypothetical protein Q8Q29_11915 [Actinomycetota bacterium]|nr:hypothetical protein [Actinomycetota bacterium]
MGGGGADTLKGGAKADPLEGSKGDDELLGGKGGDTLKGKCRNRHRQWRGRNGHLPGRNGDPLRVVNDHSQGAPRPMNTVVSSTKQSGFPSRSEQ